MSTESQTIGKLAEALAKAQGMMLNASKDKDNPFFKSTYADLASVWDACRVPLSSNGLCVTQAVSILENKLILTTKLIHLSGEWMSSVIPITTANNKTDPQAIGSAITYFRRFTLQSLVGVAPEDQDDDGNLANNKQPPVSPKKYPKKHDLGPSETEGYPLATPPYRIPAGKHAKKAIEEIDRHELMRYIEKCEAGIAQDTKIKTDWWDDFVLRAESYLASLEKDLDILDFDPNFDKEVSPILS